VITKEITETEARTVIYKITTGIKKTNTQTTDFFNSIQWISDRVDYDFIAKFI